MSPNVPSVRTVPDVMTPILSLLHIKTPQICRFPAIPRGFFIMKDIKVSDTQKLTKTMY